jgi:hypothetical protein
VSELYFEGMKQIVLALLLTAVPVAAFSAFQIYMAPQAVIAAEAPSLGDLSPLSTIVADVAQIAGTGDFVKAEARITDFETAWDDAEPTMRPLNPNAWGVVDEAADHALKALRKGTPDAAKIKETLAKLSAALVSPVASAGAGGVVGKVSGIDVTDSNGHPLPCETMLTALRDAIATGKIPADKKPVADDFVLKATERCNADDDVRADEFSAQGLALAK